MVSAKISFPLIIASCFIVIGASIAGIISLWIPLKPFPAKYTASPLPSVAYAYNNNQNTAQCCAYARNVYRTIYLCNGRGIDPCEEGKTSTTQTITSTISPTSSPPPRFYLYKYSGEEAEFTPSSYYSERYPIASTTAPTPTTVTVTIGSGSSTITSVSSASAGAVLSASASASASAGVSASASAISRFSSGSASGYRGYGYSYSSSSSAVSSYLAGYVVSTSALPPTQTTFNIHIPRPKYPARIYMTVYQSIAIAFVLAMLLQLLINLLIAWRSLNPNRVESDNELNVEQENKGESPPPYSEQQQIASRFIFSIRSNEEDEEIQRKEESQSRLIRACNLLPAAALGGLWLWLIIPLWIMSIAAIGIQGTNFRDLQAFLNAGACGKSTSLYSTWERLICSGYPSRKPYIYTPDPSNKSLTLTNYAWPLVISIAMFVVIFVGLWIFFISYIVRGIDAGDRFKRNYARQSQQNPRSTIGDRTQTTNYQSSLPFFTFLPFSNMPGHSTSGGGGDGGGGGGCC